MTKFYPDANPNPEFPNIEEQVLAKWKTEDTFRKSIRGDSEFIFYDGPPFANGLPHYGHLLSGFIKDIFARYQTIKGKKVDRRFGWDCHGLPAEMPIEKELGISGKVSIEKFGVDNFNNLCRESVLKYTKDWEFYVNRQARWVDFENDYKTMEKPYMESVIWAFKQIYDKGLIYESMRVMPYSWACETPVSDFETRLDNSYREKVSQALTVAFTLKEKPKNAPDGYKNYKILAWTTTAWTLPSNLAIAVGKDIEYAYVAKDGDCYILAADRVKHYEKELGTEVIAQLSGSELLGLTYEPLLPYFKDHANAFVILAGDFVTTEDGTGVVHMSPGFGEDDFNCCKENNIEMVCPVDNAGKFTMPIAEYVGMQVFEANASITQRLKQEHKLIKNEQYVHNYPHCWRTDTPLIYKAVPSWYLKVTAIKDKMIANNQKINWIPSHIKDGLFGKWLENARDWSISRNRYWGCPIPVWQSDAPQYPNIEVYGSIQEIEEAFGVKVDDLHKPYIDNLVRPNPKDPTGKSMMRRVPEVLDCWFESGSMPFAQVHYPFENKDWFESHFPADFIVEYVAQTRGWFYTLVVLASAIFDKPPFLNCICHGVLLGDGGQKLSKRLKNYADPTEVFNTIGADAMRWYMISSNVMRGHELIIDKDAKGMKDAVRSAIKPAWNAYNFFSLYANADQIQAQFDLTSTNLMDRYIISKCMQTIEIIEKSMDAYDTVTSCNAFEDFFEILNNWYIRRSRDRFWKSEKDLDKTQAYNTLYSVLHMLCRAASPLMPMITEQIFLNLTGNQSSVHLAEFPHVDYKVDHDLIKQMERVRDACTASLFIRNETGIRVRQPLQSVTFIGVAEQGFSDDLTQLILDEINVKEWFNLDKSKILEFANYKLQIKFPVLGKRVPHKVKDIIAAQKQGMWEFKDNQLKITDETLLPEEFELLLEPKAEYAKSISSLASNDALVLLDLNVSNELKLEGVARDLVRAIQQARKDAGFDISDRIHVALNANDNDVVSAINSWKDYIKEQTLALEVNNQAISSDMQKSSADLNGITVEIGIVKS